MDKPEDYEPGKYKDYDWGLETTVYQRIGLRRVGSSDPIAEWDGQSQTLRFNGMPILIKGLEDFAYLVKGLTDLYDIVNCLGRPGAASVCPVVSAENEERQRVLNAKLQKQAKAAKSRPAKKTAKAKQVRKKSRSRSTKAKRGAKK